MLSPLSSLRRLAAAPHSKSAPNQRRGQHNTGRGNAIIQQLHNQALQLRDRRDHNLHVKGVAACSLSIEAEAGATCADRMAPGKNNSPANDIFSRIPRSNFPNPGRLTWLPARTIGRITYAFTAASSACLPAELNDPAFIANKFSRQLMYLLKPTMFPAPLKIRFARWDRDFSPEKTLTNVPRKLLYLGL